MEYVFSKSTCSVAWNGQVLRLHQGAAWRTDDPFVKARPEFFTSVPSYVQASAPVVEEATAEPGAKRTTRRA